MTLNEYQEKAMTTCMPSSENFAYMMLNLVGEVGELASKVAKGIRKGKLYIGDTYETAEGEHNGTNHINYAPMLKPNIDETDVEVFDKELQKEAGDIAWQLAGLCHVMGWSLEDICQQNLDKLQARKQAGTINGSGDGIDGAERKAE